MIGILRDKILNLSENCQSTPRKEHLLAQIRHNLVKSSLKGKRISSRKNKINLFLRELKNKIKK